MFLARMLKEFISNTIKYYLIEWVVFDFLIKNKIMFYDDFYISSR